MKKIILIGGGGHCKVVIESILSQKHYSIAGIIDLQKKAGKKTLGVPVIGEDSELSSFFKKGIRNCFIALGSAGKPGLRIKLYGLGKKIGFKFPNIIHPAANLSAFAILGEGNYVGPLAVINAGARLGNNCIINTASIVEHDCLISDFVHLAPAVALSGGVSVGAGTHVGIGSVVIQNVKIGKNSIIGAGSIVTGDIESNVIAFGNPAKKIRKNA